MRQVCDKFKIGRNTLKMFVILLIINFQLLKKGLNQEYNFSMSVRHLEIDDDVLRTYKMINYKN